jgi:cellulose synthase/poly-beta-1,6-N-acetylglucosamine synthase-like glycosyltransferase
VAALEPIIDTLRARGLRFGTLRDVFGGRSQADVNPPAPHFFSQRVCQLVWIGGTFGLRLVQWIALIALILSLLRIASLAVFAIVDLRRHGRKGDRLLHEQPPRAVSVVIPAYNEAKVIVRTVRSILASRHVQVEVIVLDDGSKDATADVVATHFERDSRVRVARLQNGGKATALNVGFRLASHPLVVALDADTQFFPDTVAELVRHFEDDRVAAVAGRAVVGNPRGILGRWQALEYVLGQAVERRAWHALGLVSVVPGAVGAWRRDAVLEAGGFGRDTLAEDCDLTIDLQVHGWRVAYAPQAIGLTEAPDSVAALIKQRFRWSFGVLQTIWKHRGAALRSGATTRRVGLLLIPTVFISHFSTPLFGPATTMAAALAIYLGYWSAILPYAIASLAADAALTVFALRLDRAPATIAYDWIVFRTFYRWILFVALVRAALAAVRGGAVGWGKLVRKGTVRLQTHEVPN